MSNSIEIQAALVKGRHFSNYQERSRWEVEQKLKEWGLAAEHFNKVLDQLTEEGLLNEERFARTYAGSKFRLKNWGKLKIRQGLSRKGIHGGAIDTALTEIDDEEYVSKLKRLIAKKSSMPGDSDKAKKQAGVARYAVSQGYEPSKVWDIIQKLSSD